MAFLFDSPKTSFPLLIFTISDVKNTWIKLHFGTIHQDPKQKGQVGYNSKLKKNYFFRKLKIWFLIVNKELYKLSKYFLTDQKITKLKYINNLEELTIKFTQLKKKFFH